MAHHGCVTPNGNTPELGALRVLAHPLRLRLLSLLTGSAMSAAEAARALGDTQANVSYHLRRLHEAGLLDIVETVAIRGGQAKRYRHDPATGESLDLDEPGGHVLLMAAMAEELQRRAALRVPRTPAVFTDSEFLLAPADWARARDLARELGILLSDSALPAGALKSGASKPSVPRAIRVAATVSLFEMADAPGSTA